MNKIYITYGKGLEYKSSLLPDKKHLDFKPNIINKIPNTLWGSPVDANYGWKEWCNDSLFRKIEDKNSFKWTLKDCAKVFFIQDFEDIDKLPYQIIYDFFYCIDFEKIANEYDAIEISMDKHHIGHCFKSEKEIAFNTWDCDSIMVINKDVIVPVL